MNRPTYRTFPIAILLFTIVVNTLYLPILAYSATSVDTRPLPGNQAPAFISDILQTSETYSFNEETKPVIINFWASWCGPCHQEAPDLVQAHQQFGDQLDILAVNMTRTDDEEGIFEFMSKYKPTFPILLDPKGTISSDYQILALPTTFFVDENQVIQHVHQGMLTSEQLQAQIEELLHLRPGD